MTSSEQRTPSLGRDYFWNTAWSFMVAGATVIMLIIVTRAAGVAAAGVFSIALAIGQQFQTLGMYEVRTYQVTDVQGRFTFGTYLAVRILTVLLMVLGILLASWVFGSDLKDSALIAFVALLRVFDAIEDVYYSELQRQGRLDIAGRAGFIRSFVTTAVFSIGIWVTGDLFATTAVTFLVSFATMVLVFIPPSRALFSLRPLWQRERIRLVLLLCLPLALASFISIYLANAPRFAISFFLDKEHQGYFALLFMPAFAINLLSTIVFRPLLTRMATLWVSHNVRGFLRIVYRGLSATLLSFLLVGGVTFFLGVAILNILSGKDISDYLLELMVLVFGGAMNSASVILYYALTTMRRQSHVFVGYAVAALAITVFLIFLVPPFHLLGASIGYAGAMSLLSGYFFLALFMELRRDENCPSISDLQN